MENDVEKNISVFRWRLYNWQTDLGELLLVLHLLNCEEPQQRQISQLLISLFEELSGEYKIDMYISDRWINQYWVMWDGHNSK